MCLSCICLGCLAYIFVTPQCEPWALLCRQPQRCIDVLNQFRPTCSRVYKELCTDKGYKDQNQAKFGYCSDRPVLRLKNTDIKLLDLSMHPPTH